MIYVIFFNILSTSRTGASIKKNYVYRSLKIFYIYYTTITYIYIILYKH